MIIQNPDNEDPTDSKTQRCEIYHGEGIVFCNVEEVSQTGNQPCPDDIANLIPNIPWGSKIVLRKKIHSK